MKKVNIVLGRFQPITLGHLKIVDALYKENKLPTVFCLVSNTKFDQKHPFSDDLIAKEINEVIKKDYPVEGYVYIKSADIVKYAEELHKNNFEPILWGCGTDRYIPYKKQADKYKGDAKLLPEFDCFEVKRTDDDISATKVRYALKNDDIGTFKKMMPKGSEKLFNDFREQLLTIKENKIWISLVDFIKESLEEDKKKIIDYLKNKKNPPEEKVVKKLIVAFEQAKLNSAEFERYVTEDSGLTMNVVNSMINSLEDLDSDAKAFIGFLSNYEKFDDLTLDQLKNAPINEILKKYIEGISNEGISRLIGNKTVKGTISNGPGENIIALVYKNAKKAQKGDIQLDDNIIECKFGGGKISSTNCTGMRNVWAMICREIKKEFKIDGITWVPKQPGPSIEKWLNNIKESKNHDKIIEKLSNLCVVSIHEMFKKPSKYNIEDLSKLVHENLSDIKNLNVVNLLKVLGCLSIIAYKNSEGFTHLLIEDGKGKKDSTYLYKSHLLINNFDFNNLMKLNLNFTSPNTDPSYGGGGLTIRLVKITENEIKNDDK